MRIRKNYKRLGFSLTNPSTASQNKFVDDKPPSIPSILQTDCKLNQSPWDVISFSSTSKTFSIPNEYQVKFSFGDKVIGRNVDKEVTNDSKGKQVAQRHHEEEVKEKGQVEDKELKEEEAKTKRFSLLSEVDEGRKKKRAKKEYLFCIKSDGKGWQCKKATKEGHYLCEHHRNKLRSYKRPKPHDRKCVSMPRKKIGEAHKKQNEGEAEATTASNYVGAENNTSTINAPHVVEHGGYCN